MHIKPTALYAPEDGGSGGGGSTLLGSIAGGGESQQQAQQQSSGGDDEGPPPSFDFRSSLDDKGNFKPGWQASLPEDLKPFADVVAKYQNPVELIRGHGNAAKLIGQRPTLKPPAPDAKPEDVAAWRTTIGVPETPEGYGLKKPDSLPEGVTWDDAEVASFAKFAHENNLTPAQVQALTAYELKQRETMVAKGKAGMEQFVEGQKQALQTKWGAKFEENGARAVKAASLLGLDINDPEIGNNAKLIEALYNASALFSEDKFVGADKAGMGLTGAAQAEDIARNPLNPWHAAYHGKEGKARQEEAAALMNRLRGAKA
jgi:hypothetical protein